jgi:hypothetical protein
VRIASALGIQAVKMAVYVVQKIGEKGRNPKTNPAYVDTVSEKTAGQIANDLVIAAEGLNDPRLRAQVKPLANQFKALTKRCNDLMHANPGTSRNKEQCLFRHCAEWTIVDVDEFKDSALRMNDLFYNVL